MSDLVLEHLKHIRDRVDAIDAKVSDVQQRMTGLEQGVSLVKREMHLGDETDARQQATLDRLLARIERIERRLDLTE